MDKQAAVKLVKDTLENPFDKGKFINLSQNLVKYLDASKNFIYQGNIIPEKAVQVRRHGSPPFTRRRPRDVGRATRTRWHEERLLHPQDGRHRAHGYGAGGCGCAGGSAPGDEAAGSAADHRNHAGARSGGGFAAVESTLPRVH